MNELRREYLNKLQPLFVEISHYFLGTMAIELIFQCGWDDSLSFKDVLVNELHKDLRYGYTHSGAHRDDFSVLLNGRKAKDFVSRGQLKVLMLALKLAQIKLINSDQNNSVCVLIDDLTAELDDLNKGKLLSYLSSLECQVFMTTTELSNFGDLNLLQEYKVFHVEHGQVKEVNNSLCST